MVIAAVHFDPAMRAHPAGLEVFGVDRSPQRRHLSWTVLVQTGGGSLLECLVWSGLIVPKAPSLEPAQLRAIGGRNRGARFLFEDQVHLLVRIVIYFMPATYKLHFNP